MAETSTCSALRRHRRRDCHGDALTVCARMGKWHEHLQIGRHHGVASVYSLSAGCCRIFDFLHDSVDFDVTDQMPPAPMTGCSMATTLQVDGQLLAEVAEIVAETPSLTPQGRVFLRRLAAWLADEVGAEQPAPKRSASSIALSCCWTSPAMRTVFVALGTPASELSPCRDRRLQ